MARLGYASSSEEHHPNDLVEHLVQAEDVGFQFALMSDHFHPWVSAQGQSPFVWAVLGGVAEATNKIEIGTGVTCPIMRIHPAILAQAAATIASMMEGRFFFGVGTGENLNEHILGDRWVPYDIRAEMFEEAIGLIRELWKGEVTNHWGDYFTVEDARIYTVPNQLPPIMIAAAGPQFGRDGRASRRRLDQHIPRCRGRRKVPRGWRRRQTTLCASYRLLGSHT